MHKRIGLRLPGPRALPSAHHLLSAAIAEGVRAAEEAGRLQKAGRVKPPRSSEAIGMLQRLPCVCAFARHQGKLWKRGGFQSVESSDAQAPAESTLSSAGGCVLRKVGGIRQRRGDNQSAYETFEKALALIDRVDDTEEHLHLYNELAALHLFRGELSRSAIFANRGLEILGSPPTSLNKDAQAYHSLNFHSAAGHILLRQFEYQRAAEEFLRGLKFAEKIHSLSNIARILNNLGIAYHQANRLNEALTVYRRATNVAEIGTTSPRSSASAATWHA